jgi:hypothetical protein
LKRAYFAVLAAEGYAGALKDTVTATTSGRRGRELAEKRLALKRPSSRRARRGRGGRRDRDATGARSPEGAVQIGVLRL